MATYHMPCLFGSDEKCRVMVAHVALLMQQAQRFAAGDPLVVCGDFNVQPGQPAYDLVLSGDMDASHPQHPELPACCAPKPGDAGRQGSLDGGLLADAERLSGVLGRGAGVHQLRLVRHEPRWRFQGHAGLHLLLAQPLEGCRCEGAHLAGRRFPPSRFPIIDGTVGPYCSCRRA